MFRKYGGAVYSFKAFELTFLNSPADLRTNIFGNPHAIRFNPNRVGNTHPFYKHWIQLAAFIPVPAYSEMAHDLIRATPPIIIEKYSRPD